VPKSLSLMVRANPGSIHHSSQYHHDQPIKTPQRLPSAHYKECMSDPGALHKNCHNTHQQKCHERKRCSRATINFSRRLCGCCLLLLRCRFLCSCRCQGCCRRCCWCGQIQGPGVHITIKTTKHNHLPVVKSGRVTITLAGFCASRVQLRPCIRGQIQGPDVVKITITPPPPKHHHLLVVKNGRGTPSPAGFCASRVQLRPGIRGQIQGPGVVTTPPPKHNHLPVVKNGRLTRTRAGFRASRVQLRPGIRGQIQGPCVVTITICPL
jgi:hypothetical protein